MSKQEITKDDYLSRINSVILYIEKNIDTALTLDEISCHANFSPFHFHRIFTSLIGETPADFILRLRTEKAAKLLQKNKNSPIIEIAYRCGFTNHTSFSRAFRKYFSITAHEFQKKEKAVFSNNKQFYNLSGEIVERTENAIQYEDISSHVSESISFFQDADIQIKQMPGFEVAYINYIGDFYNIGSTYLALFEWASMHQLLSVPNAKLFTVYHDDPAVTRLNRNRQSVCITVPNALNVSGKIGKMTIAEGKYLVGYFELIESEFDKGWSTMYLTAIEKGYKLRDAYVYEMYEAKGNNLFSQPYKVYMCLPIE